MFEVFGWSHAVWTWDCFSKRPVDRAKKISTTGPVVLSPFDNVFRRGDQEILNIFRIIFEYSTIHCVPNIDPYIYILYICHEGSLNDDPMILVYILIFFSKLEEPQKGFDRFSLRCLGSRPVLSNG